MLHTSYTFSLELLIKRFRKQRGYILDNIDHEEALSLVHQLRDLRVFNGTDITQVQVCWFMYQVRTVLRLGPNG